MGGNPRPGLSDPDGRATPPTPPALDPLPDPRPGPRIPCPCAAGARPPLQSPRKSAQVVDAKDAAYLHAYLHIFACLFNVSLRRAVPRPVGGGFVFLWGVRCTAAPSPAPRNPRRCRILGGGRPRARGRGFPPSLTQICAGSAPATFPIPAEGFFSVICLPETTKTAKCPSGRDGVAAPGAPPLPPPPPPSCGVCAPSQPGPELPGPFHCPAGVSGALGAPNPSSAATSPVPPSRTPIKALKAAWAYVHSSSR